MTSTKTKLIMLDTHWQQIVKSYYPFAELHYLDQWDREARRFVRIYSVYMDGDLGSPWDAHKKRISSGVNAFEAWKAALIAIQKGYK